MGGDEKAEAGKLIALARLPISATGQGSTRETEGEENGKMHKNGRQHSFLFGGKDNVS